MTESIVKLPDKLDLVGVLAASYLLQTQPESERYIIDFNDLSFVEPFGMLLFVTQLREFRKSHAESKFRAEGYKNHGYLAHMGFFQAFGLNYGNEPGQAPGNLQYVPITRLGREELLHEAGLHREDERETIERNCMKLAGVLVRRDTGPIFETLSYSLRETFRNVLEHSRADAIWYAAQYWPEKEWVELCILDEGIGIRATLQRNKNLTINSDHDALQMALLPGVSGVAFKGGPRQRKDEWANSGYGLFMTSQLCQRGGSFAIISHSSCLLFQNNNQSRFDCNFQGTAIRLQFHMPQIAELSASLSDLMKMGSDIASSIKHNANITASMSSRMLFGRNCINDSDKER